MSNYAVVKFTTRVVENIILWDGSPGWSPDDGFIAVESDVAQIGWIYANGAFAAPPPQLNPEPTAEEILAKNRAQQTYLLTQASQAMTSVLVSLQLGDATDDETIKAKAWQSYYRALKLVDLSITLPDWPTFPA